MKSQTIHTKGPPMVKAQQNCHLQVTTKILSLKKINVFFSLLNKIRIVRVKKQKIISKIYSTTDKNYRHFYGFENTETALFFFAGSETNLIYFSWVFCALFLRANKKSICIFEV